VQEDLIYSAAESWNLETELHFLKGFLALQVFL